MGRRGHGHHRGPSAGERQVGHSHGGEPLLQVRALHPARPSLYVVARAFLYDIVRLHSIPSSIVSNRDLVLGRIVPLSDVQLHMSSAFHPQTDRQTELVNQVITMYMCCPVGDRPRSWLKWLSRAECCYNTSYQTVVQSTPFRIVYGRYPPSLLTYQRGSTRTAVDRQLQDYC